MDALFICYMVAPGWDQPEWTSAELFAVPPDDQQIEDPMLPYIRGGRQSGSPGTR